MYLNNNIFIILINTNNKYTQITGAACLFLALKLKKDKDVNLESLQLIQKF